MKQIISITISLLFLQIGIVKAQEITMSLGGPTHSGVYNTKPIKKFTGVKWKTELEANGGENFIIKDNILYVNACRGTYSERKGYFYAIDAITGKLNWKDSIDRFVSSPTMKDSILYYGSDDKDCKIRALNNKNGKLVWELKLDRNSCWPPALYNDKAYFGDHGGNWFVVNNITGFVIYKQKFDSGICNSSSILDSIIYFSDESGKLHAINGNTNIEIWTFNSGSKSLNAPSIVNGVAYLITESGTLYAINIKNGSLLWSYKTDDSMYRGPAVSDGIATLITTNGHIYAFNIKDGSVLWETKKAGLGYTNTAIAGNIVYVGCADNHLYAFDLKTGKEIWNFKCDSPVNTPLIDNCIVYFTCGKYLYALE